MLFCLFLGEKAVSLRASACSELETPSPRRSPRLYGLRSNAGATGAKFALIDASSNLFQSTTATTPRHSQWPSHETVRAG